MDFIVKGFPEVDTYHLCCSTKIGTRIIGWLNLFGHIVVCGPLNMDVLNLWRALNEGIEKVSDKVNLAIEVLMCTVLLCQLALAVLLLVGVYRDQLDKVRLWLRVTVVLYIVAIALTSLRIALAIARDHRAESVVPVVVLSVFKLAFGYYMIALIKSYYTSKRGEFQ